MQAPICAPSSPTEPGSPARSQRRWRRPASAAPPTTPVAIADGGDCVADLGVLRGQEVLFGAVASKTTAHRVVKSIDAAGLERIRAAWAAARERAWDAGARPDRITLDIDATLISAHSEKEDAAGNYKRGFGFHPLLCYLDETSEALAGMLRPGNAGSNAAAGHFTVLEAALEQIPEADLDREILARCDSGGATHAFTHDCRSTGIRFSVGYELTEAVREAILELPESAWAEAIDADGELREGAWVAELTDSVELGARPEGTRLICHRQRPHPGAQFEIFDAAGYRDTCFLTDQEGGGIAALELRQRRRARVEDAIRCGKDTGMRNLPFGAFASNEAWLELSLAAQDLLAHSRALCLDGELALAEPKRLRQRVPGPLQPARIPARSTTRLACHGSAPSNTPL